LKTATESISDNASSHEFTYAPSGLRVRDKRTGVNAIDKRFVYTTSGALLSVHESPSKRRDIVYANGEAIAEIDQDGNVYELHNDHLGTPRYITNGNTAQSSKGQVIGQQAFGPYGEELVGTYNGQVLPTGYKPATGYTGHLNEDLSGLIYMKGRYYSPLWHRFINSDQGVDPKSINQYAYVGGSPFMAKDPSGMAATMYCTTYHYSTGDTVFGYNPETGLMEATVVVKDNSYKVCYTLDWDDWRGGWPGDYGEVGGESGGGIGPGQQENKNNDCGTESVGELLDRKGYEAYQNGNYAAWIGLGYLNAAYKVFTPGGDSLSQLNARAWNGESIAASELATTGLWATAHLGLTAAPGLAPGLANSRSVGTALHNSKIAGVNFRPGTPINSGYVRLGWDKAPDSFQRFRLAIGNDWKIDFFKSGVKNGVKCGPK
jgi:RHS repeat-associated protein